LKLKCDEPLSNFAFNFNLRRYTMGIDPSGAVASEGLRRVTAFRDLAASLAD
jgi:hypothetical protein